MYLFGNRVKSLTLGTVGEFPPCPPPGANCPSDYMGHSMHMLWVYIKWYKLKLNYCNSHFEDFFFLILSEIFKLRDECLKAMWARLP